MNLFSSFEPSSGSPPKEPVVLYIEDDKHWREVVTAALQCIGIDVLTAADATEALVKVEQATVVVIVLDLDLSGESGAELMKFLRHNHPDVPVIVHTGLDHSQSAIDHIFAQGASAYVRKGHIGELIQAVRSHSDLQAR